MNRYIVEIERNSSDDGRIVTTQVGRHAELPEAVGQIKALELSYHKRSEGCRLVIRDTESGYVARFGRDRHGLPGQAYAVWIDGNGAEHGEVIGSDRSER